MLPFLALGLGVDDMFVLAHHFKASGGASGGGGAAGSGGTTKLLEVPAAAGAGAAASAEEVVVEVVRHCLSKAGPSITLTSAVNVLVFFVGSLTPIPAVTAFCQQACLAVLMNYLLLIGIFPAVMALDARRTQAGRADLLCCITLKQNAAAAREAGGAGGGGGGGGTEEPQGATTAATGEEAGAGAGAAGSSESGPIAAGAGAGGGGGEGGRGVSDPGGGGGGKCAGMLRTKYLPALATPAVQYGVLGLKARKRTSFAMPFHTEMKIVPRQARDNLGKEHSKSDVISYSW